MSKHTPGPWEYLGHAWVQTADDKKTPIANFNFFAATEANARLIAAAPDMLAALHIQHACGSPEKVSLYDEEGVEGWRWTHPDGREWTAVGAWDEAPPMHPVASAAIAKAEGK